MKMQHIDLMRFESKLLLVCISLISDLKEQLEEKGVEVDIPKLSSFEFFEYLCKRYTKELESIDKQPL